MPQHGRRRAGAPIDDEEPARYGFLTMESALVLGLVAVIVMGAFLVHAVVPSKRETTTMVGDQKVRVTTVGKGGVEPGPLQYREVPAVIFTPPSAVLEVTPTPTRTKKPKKTAVPVPTVTADPEPTKGPIIGGGGGGGGGQTCTVLILCKPGETPKTDPEPEPEPTPDPEQPVTPDPVAPE